MMDLVYKICSEGSCSLPSLAATTALSHAKIDLISANEFIVNIPSQYKSILTPECLATIRSLLTGESREAVKLKLRISDEEYADSFANQLLAGKVVKQTEVLAAIESDPIVKDLMMNFGALIEPDSVSEVH